MADVCMQLNKHRGLNVIEAKLNSQIKQYSGKVCKVDKGQYWVIAVGIACRGRYV